MATQPKHEPPQGMEPYDLGGPGDLGALSPEQQEKINKFKVETRMENEKYLRQHPEVECLIAGFLGEILKKRPENIREYAARHFTNSNLPDTVMQQLEDRQEKIKQHKVLTKV
ncbi:RIIa domain-containing protein 1-like [Lineus longissimus]|uniref:RIIa domain-containing protein 1-like n=1 Tax=Lineus longissimus TaxID=88925 RepID=UPI002B4C96F1